MMKRQYEKSTLESTVNLYRKQLLLHSDNELEFEIKFDVQYIDFLAISKNLIKNYKKNILYEEHDFIDVKILRLISAIKDFINTHSMIRRDITYYGEKNTKTDYINKKLLTYPPYMTTNENGLNYKITLSSEKIDSPIPLSESTIIRVKLRLSIPLQVVSNENPSILFIWSIDLSIVKEMSANDAKKEVSETKAVIGGGIKQKTYLDTIIDYLFKEDTIENFSSILESSNVNENLYKYEIELELLDAIQIDNGVELNKKTALGLLRPSDVLSAINSILSIQNPDHKNELQYMTELYNIAKYIVHQKVKLSEYKQNGTLKRLLPKAISLTKNSYGSIYPPKGFYLTDKADGVRCIAIVRNGIGILITTKIIKVIPLITITDGDCITDTILDGEYIEDIKAHEAHENIEDIKDIGDIENNKDIENKAHETINGKFYAFDIIALTGINVSLENFNKRFEYLPNGVEILNKVFGDAFAEMKPIHLIEDCSPEYLEGLIRQTYEAPRPYEKDGLIFIESYKPYELTTSYKWKPLRDTTIDFLVKKAPRELYGINPYIERAGFQMYILFVGIKVYDMERLNLQIMPQYEKIFKKNISENLKYVPIQFMLSDVPYAYIYYHPKTYTGDSIDNKIVEFRCAGDCKAAGGGSMLIDWEIVRIREDRTESKTYYGNHFQVAEATWSNYIDPFNINELWDSSNNTYFKSVKEQRYNAMVKVINAVKDEFIASQSHSNWIIDIGAGKGQDLGRYFNAGIKNLIAIDQDKTALVELLNRRQSFIKQKRSDYGGKPKKYTSVYVIVSDINHDDPNDVIRKCEEKKMGKCNAIICNLAFHYFLGTSESIHNFMKIAEATVAEDGLLYITCFSGIAVHNKFMDNNIEPGKSWDLKEDGILKYSLKRLYSSDELEPCGQKIGVLLPFSMGGYYEEYLFNYEYIRDEFAKVGFGIIEKNETLDNTFSSFGAKDHRTFGQLSEHDKTYLSLYCQVIFKQGAAPKSEKKLSTKKLSTKKLSEKIK
jgi:hypothetical protein